MVEAIKSRPTKKSQKNKNCKKIPTTGSSEEIMDEQIWKEFPNDLFEAVIARLPVAAIFRFQLVCQKWNSLLSSSSFSQHYAKVPQTYPWFYTITHESVHNGAMYDPFLKKWYDPRIPSLPKKEFILPMCSAGGLICFLDIGHQNFYICNPLTQSSRELPTRSFRVWSQVAVGMTLSRNAAGNNSYKILRVECYGDHEVYDSGTNCWTCPGVMPPNIKLPLSLNYQSQAVSVDNMLYFMRANPYGIISYDMVGGTWNQYVIPLPQHLTDCTLAVSGTRILLVGLLYKNAATCVCVWELQKMTLLWKELDLWCFKFHNKCVKMTCLGNQGLLMLSLRSRQMNCLVTYDASSREWQKVPGCLVPCGLKPQCIAWGTTFYPRATALP